jgi:hypothetical protein
MVEGYEAALVKQGAREIAAVVEAAAVQAVQVVQAEEPSP